MQTNSETKSETNSETKSELHSILSEYNKHERDSNIVFEEERHKYIITNDNKSHYTSVTTWNHQHFPKFNSGLVIYKMMSGKQWKEGHKYWGMTPQEIKNLWFKNGSKVSEQGTELHYEIECFMNQKNLSPDRYTNQDLLDNYNPKQLSPILETLEWQYFLNFMFDHPNMQPYRTEWKIYDEELKLAGSIDMVYKNTDGTLSIYDWKRVKEINKMNNYDEFAITPCISHFHNSNFWHYTLQLNTYRAILERKYGFKIKDLFLVKIHPDNEEQNYELFEVPILEKEINDLFALRSLSKDNKI